MEGVKPITFKALGKNLPKLPELSPQITVRMSDFADYGYCPYRAWHLSQGTLAVRPPKTERAVAIGRIVHDELDRIHEDMITKLPEATEKTRHYKYKPLEFDRNFPVYLHHGPFFYSGKIDNLCREADGHFYITDDKTTKRPPDKPWRSNLLQVWAYCAGMASTYWHIYDARYLYWRIRYLDKTKKEILGEHGGFYSKACHEILWSSLEDFEAIYQGNDPGYEVNPKKCIPCGFAPSCPFKAT